MKYKRYALAVVMLALWACLLRAPAQERDTDGNPADRASTPTASEAMSSFFSGKLGGQGNAWIGESLPAGAIPGDRHITDGSGVIVAVSADGRQLFGFSDRVPKWVRPDVEAPGDPKIVLVAADQVAAAWSGNVCFAYSGVLGRWDVVRLGADESAIPAVSNGVIAVHSEMADYVFKAEWGKWFSAEEIKAGRVAEYLEQAAPASTSEALQTYVLEHADASATVRIIREVLSDKQLAIEADTRTNRVVVRGSEAVLQLVEGLIRGLDLAKEPTAGAPSGEESEGAKAAIGSVSELKAKYEAAEKETLALAKKIRGVEARLSGSLSYSSRPLSAIAGMRRELREKVSSAFRLRQQLLEAELDVLEKRMQDTRKSVESRDRIAEQVIDRRVDDLLNPLLRWEAAAGAEPEPDAGENHSDKADADAGNEIGEAQDARPTAVEQAKWESATVEIHANDGSQWSCCGVIVSADGLILTQFNHDLTGGLTREKRTIFARFDDGSEMALEPVAKPGASLFALKPVDPIKVHHFFPLAPRRIQEGDALYGVWVDGSHYALEGVNVTLAERRIARYGVPVMQLRSNSHLHSGAPIIARDGALVGIVATGDGPPGAGRIFAIPTATLIEIFKAAGVDITSPPTTVDQNSQGAAAPLRDEPKSVEE